MGPVERMVRPRSLCDPEIEYLLDKFLNEFEVTSRSILRMPPNGATDFLNSREELFQGWPVRLINVLLRNRYAPIQYADQFGLDLS